jgi:LacI family transcriptional regulator
LNYRPNTAARAIVTGRFHCVTLLMSVQPKPLDSFVVLPGMLDGICNGLAEQDYHLNIARLCDPDVSEESLPKALRENLSDGLLLSYSAATPQRIMGLIDRYNIPSICINIKRQADCVFPDDVGAARMGTQHLIELGHRRILYLRNVPQPHFSAADRREGYLAAMSNAGLEPRVLEIDQLPSCQAQEIERLFSGPDRPTAVLSYAPAGSAFMLAVAARFGLSVPRDLSLMQISEDCHVAGLNVGNVVLPWQEVGRIAAMQLLGKIKEPGRVYPPAAILPTLLEDQDTVVPPL